LRILHVTPSFCPAWAYGGIPRCAYELCRSLVRLGHSVTVWTTDALDARQRVQGRAGTVDGIEIGYFPNLSNWLAYHRQLYLPRALRAHAWRHVAEFDVVHLHSHRHLLQPLVVRPARRYGVPYVFTGHGTVPAFERYLPAKRLLDLLGARAILQQAAACIAVSRIERQHYLDAGVRPERVVVIPNGIRLDEFARLPPRGGFRSAHGIGSDPLVLFVGKITPRKGVDVLLRALPRLPANARVAIAGNFMMPAEPVHALVHRLGVGDRVRFVGFLSDHDKLAAYVDADVVAYPSTGEIFGLVPFESLMCGTPAVVCNDSGCGEVLQAAGGGLLVPYGDPEALAGALRTLLDDPTLRAACVASGRQYVAAHLGWDHIAAQTLMTYRDVVAQRASVRA
jgi:glycosyltransferase involved in cell wall biosynthesis